MAINPGYNNFPAFGQGMGNFGNNIFPFFPFFPPVINQAILVVRVGANFYQVLVFDGQAQAISITAAQAAFLQQFGVPIVNLT